MYTHNYENAMKYINMLNVTDVSSLPLSKPQHRSSCQSRWPARVSHTGRPCTLQWSGQYEVWWCAQCWKQWQTHQSDIWVQYSTGWYAKYSVTWFTIKLIYICKSTLLYYSLSNLQDNDMFYSAIHSNLSRQYSNLGQVGHKHLIFYNLRQTFSCFCFWRKK